MSLQQIRIILIEPQNPGNIGAAARAMKTMGLSQLMLINPTCFPHKDAYIRATHATDILDNCLIHKSLADAIADCQLVIATSIRDHGGFVPTLSARKSADKMIIASNENKLSIALVFGTESHGMTGEQIRLCQFCAYIPTHPDFSSLNLGAAVQTFCYEIYQAYLQHNAQKNSCNNDTTQLEYPEHQQLEYFYQQFAQMIAQSGFINKKHPGIVMQRIKAVFNRARLDNKELNIWQGLVKRQLREKRRG